MRLNRCIALPILLALWGIAGCSPKQQQAQWLDPQKFTPGPIRHEQLSAGQLQRIKSLQQTFREVDTSPLDKWVDDFKRDEHPEREIRIYEGMAEAYRSYCSGKSLTQPAKKDVYQVVLMRSGAPDSEVLPRLKLTVLKVEDAREILKGYTMAPTPIEVITKPGR